MHTNFFAEKLTIITGGFGSGKSEYAINLAINLANSKVVTTLVDLDLVNAYFRTREANDLLMAHGIKTIIPPPEIACSDLPIAGPGIRDLITSRAKGTVIFDVGGDDMGAIALSAYRQEINRVDKNVLMVVNPFRPFTSEVKNIIEMKEAIEYNSGVSITALVSNPNLGTKTAPHLILDKHLVVEKAAQVLALPVVEIVIQKSTYQSNPEIFNQLNIPVRLIDIYLSPDWLVNEH